MADNPHIESNSVPEWAMSGILYNGEDGLVRYSNRIGETHIILLPHGMGQPINICSSFNGLVACHNRISNIYYIWNPEYQDSYIALPQPPRKHDVLTTHVVLTTEFSAQPAFHLICAVHVDSYPLRYTIDTYNSLAGQWISYEAIDVGGFILPNTGISCGKFAYWLTERPRSVIRFDVHNPHVRWQYRFPINAYNAVLETRFQLGRIKNQLGLISVDTSSNSRITLYLLPDGILMPWLQYTYVVPNLNANMLPLRPIRFQSSKFDVFFWANGRLMICEASTVEPESICMRLLNAVGARAADGFAHISSRYLPQGFANGELR